MSQLFTFIVEYVGGTYISQNSATNEAEAFNNWAVSFAAHPETAKWAALLFEDSDVDGLGGELVAIDTVRNVWYTAVSGANGRAEVHIILTANHS